MMRLNALKTLRYGRVVVVVGFEEEVDDSPCNCSLVFTISNGFVNVTAPHAERDPITNPRRVGPLDEGGGGGGGCCICCSCCICCIFTDCGSVPDAILQDDNDLLVNLVNLVLMREL